MKITDVSTTLLHYPDVPGYQDATMAEPVPGRSSIFTHIQTDEGLEGLGVGQASPGVRDVIDSALRHILIGQDPMNIEKLWSDMFWAVRGYGRRGLAFLAVSAVDIGLWDLKAKALGMPLYKLLGPYREAVPVYGSGGWTNYTVDELVAEMEGYVDQGIPRIKMKVGKDFGSAEREDIERVAAVRSAVGHDVALYIDANNGYYTKQAIYMAREFEEYQVGWYEEPVLADDIPGLAEIRRATTIPLASGEMEYTKYGFRDLITGGGADIVQPDVVRVGGVTEWMKVAHMAEAFNLQVAPHMAQLVHMHVCCAIPNLKAMEYANMYLAADEVWYTEFPTQKDGFLTPYHDKPGLGLELDPYSVEKWSV